MTAKLTASAPVLLVKDLFKAAAYWRDKLGFTDQSIHGNPPNFAMVKRDGFTVMLALVDSAHSIVPNWQIVRQTWNIYFWVDDAAALYAEFQTSGAIIDYTLYDTPWGTKEFGIRDLEDHDLAFGQILH